MSKKPLLVLIDGSAIFHRGYHAIPPTFTNKAGQPTNAIYGFTMILLKVLADLSPKYAVVAWDMPGGTFRDDLYDQYKATRSATPDDLKAQMPYARTVTEALGISFVELFKYEADDIIGTFAAQAHHQKEQLETIIITGDKDQLQLIDEQTRVFLYRPVGTDPIKYDLEKMQERYGLTPKQFIDLKALMGDSSDNIPGVAGVGEKTAMTMMASYGSLDNIYAHVDELKGKLQERMLDQKDMAYLSLELSRIALDAPVKLDMEQARLGTAKKEELIELFRELDFRSLLAKLPSAIHADEAELATISAQSSVISGMPSLFGDAPVVVRDRPHLKTAKYHTVATEADLEKLAAELSKQKVFAFDTETTGLDVLTADLVGMSFSFKAEEAYYVPVGHAGSDQVQLSKQMVLQALKPILENPAIGKVGHNIKYDFEIMLRQGVRLGNVAFDTMVAAFIVNPLGRTQSLDDLASSELGVEMIPISELIGTGKQQLNFSNVSIEQATTYAAEDADMTWRLYELLAPQIPKGGYERLTGDIEWPLIPVLADMEMAGIELDSDFLAKFNKVISRRILELDELICEAAGERFNIASPSQLSRILFEKLALTAIGVKKGKTGTMSTAAGELEKLKGQHPIVDLIFEYRELAKLKNTYVDALPLMVGEDGRVHTSFNQTIAQTGRLSSTNPNLQNIPVRSELGREIRKAFVAPKGKVLISADYSQIELRVAASLSGDKAMIKTFTDGIDLHQQTAAELYGVPLEEVTKEQRYNAKTINFGVLYGMSPHGLSVATGMTREEAVGFIERYYELRPKLKSYIEGIKADARKNEYVETLFGRRRPCAEINSSNSLISNAAERMAVNVPIQGTAADIMKLAMVALAPKLTGENKLLLQIHDELIAEVPADQADAVTKIMKDTMESVYDLGVKIEVDTAVGKNWGEL